ncbi:pentapeptide repeat-containing protein [Spongiactinospora sp. 9N601]|uniref:pentapeptide repeat-containing protein n=1 Tax=Spongiactinospora sp. 9N601 TaxID=3375149 RepID=UPI00379B91BE
MTGKHPRPSARSAITSAAAAKARRNARDTKAPQEMPRSRWRRWQRSIFTAFALVVIAASLWSALARPAPQWAQWALIGIAVTLATCLGVAFLIGPAARRLAGETSPLTASERAQMTPTERVEAINAARHTLIQSATGLVVIGGVVFTALGLWYTARTVETTRESQITDRYTKAVEQLGSTKQDVRLGGIYALQRLAGDSPRDRETIGNVLAAFVRGHDACTLAPNQKTPPRRCTAIDLAEISRIQIIRPEADVLAALNIAPTLATTEPADLSEIRFPRMDLNGSKLPNANLNRANLHASNLAGARLTGTDLSGAMLRSAELSHADLSKAQMVGTDLGSAILTHTNLSGASLPGAHLPYATLHHANLRGANLTRAYMKHADLTRADLTGTDLTGADLRQIRGKTEQEIRAVAKVDSTTKFR